MATTYEKHQEYLRNNPQPKQQKAVQGVKCGLLFNKGALWIGAHYSPYNRRWCINLIPCVTFWVTLPDGKTPARAKL